MTAHEPVETATGQRPFQFSRPDYLLLCAHGTFDKVAKTELVEGVIVAVNAQYSRHGRTQTLFYRALAAACDAIDSDLSAWFEISVDLDDRNMPRPDIFISRGLPENGPVPVDRLALVVEIADTTLAFDLKTKARMYARAGLPEYWVADADARVIHMFWSPVDDAYAERREVRFGERIVAETIALLAVETAGI